MGNYRGSLEAALKLEKIDPAFKLRRAQELREYRLARRMVNYRRNHTQAAREARRRYRQTEEGRAQNRAAVARHRAKLRAERAARAARASELYPLAVGLL
jgi:hypothetical protein